MGSKAASTTTWCLLVRATPTSGGASAGTCATTAREFTCARSRRIGPRGGRRLKTTTRRGISGLATRLLTLRQSLSPGSDGQRRRRGTSRRRSARAAGVSFLPARRCTWPLHRKSSTASGSRGLRARGGGVSWLTGDAGTTKLQIIPMAETVGAPAVVSLPILHRRGRRWPANPAAATFSNRSTKTTCSGGRAA